MKNILLYLLFLGQWTLLAQTNCPYYQKYIEKGDQAAKAARYEEALDAYNIAMLHCPEKQADAQARILTVFRAIKGLKEEAEAARNRAESQSVLIRQQKDSLAVALKRDSIQGVLIKAQNDTLNAAYDTLKAVLERLAVSNQVKDSVSTLHLRIKSALYFYDQKYALGQDKLGFYFIDPNGQRVAHLGSWPYASSFDESSFAQVKKLSSAGAMETYLLDTLGNTYLLSNNAQSKEERIAAWDFSNKYLKELPKSFWRQSHQNTRVLLLNNNQLEDLPDALWNLHELTYLNLRNNKIANPHSFIPKNKGLSRIIHRANQYEKAANRINNFPTEAARLKNLRTLDISNNKLDSLPAVLTRLNSLTLLYAASNRITTLPDNLQGLEGLEDLDLSFNQLNKLPPSIGTFRNLHRLNLSFNQLKQIPDNLNGLSSLSTFNIANNQLIKLPTSIGYLSELKILNCRNNSMSELPAAVGGLNKLELLYLSGNELSQLPDTITRLSALKDLDVAGNNLMYLPERLGSLQHLISLDLGNNPLRHLPASAARLKQLEFLNMGETHLAELPVEVLKMTSLTELNLSRNQLTRLPEEIRNLAQLRILDLSYNPLSKATLTTIRAQLPWCEVRFDTSQNKRGQDRAAYVYSPEKRHLTTYRDQEQVVKQYPDYYIEWFKLSWDALLAGEYERAVTAAHKTLELNPAAVMVETNLALGYLLSNHWPEAENIYLKWKGKQFPDDVMHRLCDDLFLKDIDDLQKAGITHPDLERVKALFKS